MSRQALFLWILGAVIALAGGVFHGSASASPTSNVPYATALTAQHLGQAPQLCMLSTEQAYTPLVPPSLVTERVYSEFFPYDEDAPDMLYIWRQSIQKSGNADDRITVRVRVDNDPTRTLTLTEEIPESDPFYWERWEISISGLAIAADEAVAVSIEMTSRTDVPNPSLVLIGAVEIGASGLAVPGLRDSLGYFEFETNLASSQDMTSMGIVNLRRFNLVPLLLAPDEDDPPDPSPQNYIARLGGIQTPYMAVSLCQTQDDGTDDYVQLQFEDTVLRDDAENRERIGIEDIQACGCEEMDEGEGEGEVEGEDEEPVCEPCARFYYTLPAHLLGRAGRPRVGAAVAGSRIIADDFTLSYITPVLYETYPAFAMAMNLFPNGDFESGLYPYIIEPRPPCERLSNIIIRTDDACRGDSAAVFVKPTIPADECPEGAVIAQRPIHPDDEPTPRPLYTEANGYLYEYVDDEDEVRALEWWGVWLRHDEDADEMVACDPTHELAVYYLANASETVEQLMGGIIDITPGATYTVFGVPVTQYRYLFVLDGVMDEMDGWVGLRQPDNAGCDFYWMTSLDGDNRAMRQYDGDPEEARTSLDVNMSLCVLAGAFFRPGVTGCVIRPEIIGANQDATLTLIGRNLMFLESVLLIPEMPLLDTPGNTNDPALYIDLFDPAVLRRVSYTDRLGGSMSIDFRFSQPFNLAADGSTPICTDGRAYFVSVIDGLPTGEGLETCDILIDTIAPVLDIVEHVPVNDAAAGSPTISGDRVPPTALITAPHSMTPTNWTPSDPIIIPKNMGSFLFTDMHVYLNAGSRYDDPYTAAGADGPLPPFLDVMFEAQFTDPYPRDADNNVFYVETAGFVSTSLTNWSPFFYPDPPNNRGTARWNGSSVAIEYGEAAFVATSGLPLGDTLTATWNAQFGYASEPFRARFKLEATDRAGNRTETDNYHNINLHWLYRTRAEFRSQVDMNVENPEIYWRLSRPFEDLPDAKPGCAPLANFRLYEMDQDGELLGVIAESGWRADALRGTSPFGGSTLQTILNQRQGQWLCLTIRGADETGNIQYYSSSNIFDLELNEVDFIYWQQQGPGANPALDTSIRLELYHERYGQEGVRYRDYGAATRVPLPPLDEACDTRVNGDVVMRAFFPTADQRVANAYYKGIVWKFYKEGVLVARGVADIDDYGVASASTMNMLMDCDEHSLANWLADYDTVTGNFIFDWRSLEWGRFLAEPPEDCPGLGTFDWRLGDEGNPPDPDNPNLPSARRREIRYTLTAQTVVIYTDGAGDQEVLIDQSPATAAFSIYVRTMQERDEAPIREMSR